MISEGCLLYIFMPKVQWEDHGSKKMSTSINITSCRNFVSGALGRQCYLGNKMFFHASCHVVSMCKVLLSLTE